ncbi:hypothetical protein [Maribacter arcticus]|uniref:Beta-lactamase-inhibitor-like, PepSY-like n=1 Tax=Maribacter arcticus TaxID=561365 RepID=A0A1T5A9H9_9FLAO|nr:hypothetical protein [Maribacter arcticus]SKB31555.1 hypothetical protein SAMN05660866_00719 [Maribacter arcticus]
MKNYATLVLLALGMMFNVTAMTVSNTVEIEAVMNTVDEYVKIKSNELTPPVIEEILKQYPTSKLGAAYKNDKGEFKLVMVLKSGTRRTVYIDQHGNWINKK